MTMLQAFALGLLVAWSPPVLFILWVVYREGIRYPSSRLNNSSIE